MSDLKIEYVSIDDLKPYENNAKIHTKEQIEQIKKSIEEFGFNDPIATWHGEIVEGHGRLIAAKELGIESVPVMRLDDLSDEQRRAYTLVHNQLTMNTGWDFDILDVEIDDLSNTFDMGDFGFISINDVDIDRLFKEYDEDLKDKKNKKMIKCPGCGHEFEL